MIYDFFLENQDVFIKILKDIRGVSVYANAGIVIALLYGAVYLLYIGFCKLFKKERRLGTDHVVAVSLLLIYITAVVYIVLMSRELGEYSGVNLRLWSTWGTTVTKRAYFIENILLFIPMGILMPCAYKPFRKPYICIPCFLLFSVLIEGVQYAFSLGFVELDDVVTNTIGGTIGLLIWGIFYLIYLILGLLSGKKS